jgi:hypothetical protein
MRIQFERTGGLAGMRVVATLDTESLSPEAARELSEMVGAARFFDLPAVTAAPAPGADQFHYKLTVEAEGRRHTVETADAAAPEALRPLLQRLARLARRPS